jgi:molybdopterin-guanine dinucleotide biosynthesis protein A
MISPGVGGYVLAGGKSSRMGQDKALLKLAGTPLALHTVTKLRRVCAEVHILSSRPELEAFAPLVRDIHPDCGPMGGLEAAMEHSQYKWNLFMPVDVPFLPSAFLETWIQKVADSQQNDARVAVFTVDGRLQPLLCLLHREVAPFIRQAVQLKNYKVSPMLLEAATELAKRHHRNPDLAFVNWIWDKDTEFAAEPKSAVEPWRRLTHSQQEARHLWFANLNTRQEFADAEMHLDALDT